MSNLLLFVVSFLLALIMAWIGSKRRVGTGYSLLLSLFLSPILAIFIILFSPSLKDPRAYRPNTEQNRIAGIIFFIISAICFYTAFHNYMAFADIPSEYYHPNIWPITFLGIGFVIWGVYLWDLPMPEKPENYEEIKAIQITDRELFKQAELSLKMKKRESYQNTKYKLSSWLKSSKNKIGYTLLTLLLILIITNPGVKRFKDYKGYSTYAGLMRTQNWFVFSIYESRSYQNRYGGRYLGILFNFFPLN
ncbi:MAG: hypothetical protein ABI402_01705 [Ferruginibacter sp.]